MSNKKPLMPKATAVWLIDNTALTFDQIADFCGLHPLEVKGIADEDVAQGIKGMDPVSSGQLTREEIKRCEKRATYKLKLAALKVDLPKMTTRKRGPRYTPVSRRQDRPNAILWLVRNHPELKDAQISRLAGTTKQTITQIRDRTHWNSSNLVPQDPVTLGLCSQIDLDHEVLKAAPRAKKAKTESGEDALAETLLSAEETTQSEKPKRVASKAEIFGGEDAPSERAERDQKEAEEAARMLQQLEKLSEKEPSGAESSSDPATEPDDVATEGKATASDPAKSAETEECVSDDTKTDEPGAS